MQQLQSELVVYTTSLDEWKKLLKSKIDVYDENRKSLKVEHELWVETELNAQKENAPTAIQEQIVSILDKFKEVEGTSKKNYDDILTDLNSVTTKTVEIDSMTELLRNAEIKASNDVFSQNSLPIFELFSTHSLSLSNFIASIKSSLHQHYNEAKIIFEMQSKKIIYFLVSTTFISLLVLYFNYLYLRKKLFVKIIFV